MVKEVDSYVFFELMQVALEHRERLSHSPTESEWRKAYNDAIRQSIGAICVYAIQKLPPEQRPPEDVFWEWFGLVIQIQRQNELLDKQTAEVWKRLKEDGLGVAVLKGQGVGMEYGELASFRQSGDIDIWVKGGYQKVCDYVQRTQPTDDVAYHRFHYSYFKDTEVELHHRPTLMRNLIDDRKLARWYNSFGTDSFVYLEDKGFAVPPVEFNRIFILTHIYRHFLFEGIGLRQVMDYYFVLKNDKTCKKEETAKILKELRLTRFAEAMMWILHTQLGLEKDKLICDMNEKEGQFVLAEILQAGNFGRADRRFKGMSKFQRMVKHSIHLLLHYPSEVIWTPIWLVYHKVWKWNKVREIRKRRRM